MTYRLALAAAAILAIALTIAAVISGTPLTPQPANAVIDPMPVAQVECDDFEVPGRIDCVDGITGEVDPSPCTEDEFTDIYAEFTLCTHIEGDGWRVIAHD